MAQSTQAARAPEEESAASPNDQAVPLTVSRDELLVGGDDQMFRKLVHDFFAFTARHALIRDGHARRIGLAGIDYTILISIAHLSREGAVNVKTVAEHLNVTTGFITNATNKLQKKGVVDKTRDVVDKRRINLTVSDKGRRLLRELAPHQRRVNDAEFGSLSQEQFVQLSTIIGELVRTSEQAVGLQRYLENEAE